MFNGTLNTLLFCSVSKSSDKDNQDAVDENHRKIMKYLGAVTTLFVAVGILDPWNLKNRKENKRCRQYKETIDQ